jgi:hypothetical protein
MEPQRSGETFSTGSEVINISAPDVAQIDFLSASASQRGMRTFWLSV